MKNYLLFIIVLISSIRVNSIYACGFYPYGEDVRFFLTNPNFFDFSTFSEFYYTANRFESNDKLFKIREDNPNLQFWYEYCQKKVSYKSIEECIYKLPIKKLSNISHYNQMVNYLFEQKKFEAIEYLKFAKKCEPFNTYYLDPWERDDKVSIPIRNKIIEEIKDLVKEIKEVDIKRRYAFLAIRLAFYNGDKKSIEWFFERFFKEEKKDLVYYWSLYFEKMKDENNYLKSFFAAQIFMNVPDKRFVAYQFFDKKCSLNKILDFANTDEERANVLVLKVISQSDRSLEYIRRIYKMHPENRALPFLLLREINKIEDWILTPYYTQFAPSVFSNLDFVEKKINQKMLLRINADREYARQVLLFVEKVDKKRVVDSFKWKVFKIQLLFLSGKYKQSLEENRKINRRSLSIISPLLSKQLQMIEVLAILSSKSKKIPVLTSEMDEVLFENSSESKFLFAVARALEYGGNKVDAAIVFSTLKNGNIYWKSLKNKKRSYRDYFYDYFQYIDRLYDVETVKKLEKRVSSIEMNDEISQWKFNVIKKDLPRLYDLIGTQLVRKDQLKEALGYFLKLDESYWTTHYGLWDKSSQFNNQFDKNPFFTLKNTPNFINKKEDFILNKTSILQRMLAYKDKAKASKSPEYYYFLIANCYYNMTKYGNSWMMRRFNLSHYDVAPFPEDEVEFNCGNLAKEYYKKAFDVSMNDKFKALSLRMMARCESFYIAYELQKQTGVAYDYNENIVFDNNEKYKLMYNLYPDFYEELTSNCNSFKYFFSN